MPVDRRSILTGGALLALAASAPAQAAAKPDGAAIGPIPKALKNAAVYVPGYFPEHAYANGKAVAENRRFNRAVRKGAADPEDADPGGLRRLDPPDAAACRGA